MKKPKKIDVDYDQRLGRRWDWYIIILIISLIGFSTFKGWSTIDFWIGSSCSLLIGYLFGYRREDTDIINKLIHKILNLEGENGRN